MSTFAVSFLTYPPVVTAGLILAGVALRWALEHAINALVREGA
jgi:hypothetical protein